MAAARAMHVPARIIPAPPIVKVTAIRRMDVTSGERNRRSIDVMMMTMMAEAAVIMCIEQAAAHKKRHCNESCRPAHPLNPTCPHGGTCIRRPGWSNFVARKFRRLIYIACLDRDYSLESAKQCQHNPGQDHA